MVDPGKRFQEKKGWKPQVVYLNPPAGCEHFVPRNTIKNRPLGAEICAPLEGFRYTDSGFDSVFSKRLVKKHNMDVNPKIGGFYPPKWMVYNGNPY